MSVWLMPAPECFAAFFFTCRHEEDLGPVVDALRPLRLNGTLRSVMHIGNDYKVLTATSRFPWSESGPNGPLDRAAMEPVRRLLNVGCWSGSGGLYGTRGQVREAKRAVRRALRGKVERLQFVDDRLLAIMRRFATPFRLVTGWDLRRTLTLLQPVYHLLKGVPTDSTMASAYWRKRGEVPSDPSPERDRCGLLWCSPVVPATGADALRVSQIASETLLGHGFEPQMSISVATERSLVCVITISYDREVPGEDAKAMRCYRALTDCLLASGYPPYRLNVESMDYLAEPGSAYAQLLERVKSALDPKGVLAPGRYDGQRTRTRTTDEQLAFTG
jgi:4-cresol dehydrogenase (hydroxylating) flavoprotein subunit